MKKTETKTQTQKEIEANMETQKTRDRETEIKTNKRRAELGVADQTHPQRDFQGNLWLRKKREERGIFITFPNYHHYGDFSPFRYLGWGPGSPVSFLFSSAKALLVHKRQSYLSPGCC